MKTIEIGKEIKEAAPSLRVLQIECEVVNGPTSDALWHEILEASSELASTTPTEAIKERPAIKATRNAYKALGKDPNRYRPSSEALCRRIVSGKGIYRLTTLVDVINLVSITSGHSIGGFDADKIEGETLHMQAGKSGEPFCGIGRGPLNIEFLPVYHDSIGGIGTPTSDEERTKLTEGTTRLLMLVNIYSGCADEEAEALFASIEHLLQQYASGRSIEWKIID